MEVITRLSISEFSKICKVSTKTLRYHDEIGLIHPDVTARIK
ncbi:MerR family DNA-binding transcriptional regulator, partial [Bacillus subtilis]